MLPILLLAFSLAALYSIWRRGRPIEANAEASFSGTLDEVWSRVVEADIPRIMPGRGVLPAVVSLKDASHPQWGSEERQHRTFVLADDSTILETVIGLARPNRLTYVLSDITGIFRLMVTGAQGEFTFEQDGESVRVRWHYQYQPRSAFTVIAAVLIIRTLWQPYMGHVLGRIG